MDWSASYEPRTGEIAHAKEGTKEYWHEVGHKKQDERGLLELEDWMFITFPLVSLIAVMFGRIGFYPLFWYSLFIYGFMLYLELDAQWFAEKQMLKNRRKVRTVLKGGISEDD